MKTALPLIVMLMSAPPAYAQAMIGTATAVDGDSLDMGSERIRLHAIDAVEAAQTCKRDGQEWNCGAEAKAFLAELVAGQSVVCQQVDRDPYGRMVAVCKAGSRDLGKMMVDAGYAMALPQFGPAYIGAEENARTRAAGIWNSTFEKPADYRLAHPHSVPPAKNPKAVAASRTNRVQGSSSNSVYFRNCREARAAGAAPIYRGQPGYRSGMDGDGDGIACEPYRGR